MPAPTPPDPRITLALIRQRSVDDAGCWIWTASMCNGHPSIRFGGRVMEMARRWAWMLANDQPIPPGHVITCRPDRCDHRLCVNPAHLECIPRGQRWARSNRSGALSTEAFAARVSAAKSAQSALSDEAVADILTGREPAPQAAARHGITAAYVYMIRRGEYRRFVRPASAAGAANNPFAGLERGLLRA